MSVPAPPPRKHRQTPDSGTREYYPAVEKGSSGMGVPRKIVDREYVSSDFMNTPRTGRDNLPIKTESILQEVADAVVGADVSINGEMEFDKMIRIEGCFEGKLITNGGHVIVGKNGTLVGDLSNVGIVIVFGKLIGNVNVTRVLLRGTGQIHGDVTCKSMGMDPDVICIGKVNVNPQAPSFVDPDGKPMRKPYSRRPGGPQTESAPASPRLDESKEDNWESTKNEKKGGASSNTSSKKKLPPAEEPGSKAMSASNSKKSVAPPSGKNSNTSSKKSLPPADGKMSNSNSKQSLEEGGPTPIVEPAVTPENKDLSDFQKDSKVEEPEPEPEPAPEPESKQDLEKTPFEQALAENAEKVAEAENAEA